MDKKELITEQEKLMEQLRYYAFSMKNDKENDKIYDELLEKYYQNQKEIFK